MNIDTLYHQADATVSLLDDSDTDEYPIPPFRVMSNLDTTLIDASIKEWFEASISTQDTISDAEAQVRTDTICIFYDDLCQKMIFESAYTEEDKYTFTLYLIYLVTQIDANVVKENV
jgi:hypothetical protein